MKKLQKKNLQNWLNRKFIAEKKAILVKYREDVEQVSLFGMEREDFEEKKEACKALVEKLRVLEKEVK